MAWAQFPCVLLLVPGFLKSRVACRDQPGGSKVWPGGKFNQMPIPITDKVFGYKTNLIGLIARHSPRATQNSHWKGGSVARPLAIDPVETGPNPQYNIEPWSRTLGDVELKLDLIHYTNPSGSGASAAGRRPASMVGNFIEK